MFQSARIKLTAWYLLIIMFISFLFSLTIYSNVSHQIENLVHRQNQRIREFPFSPPNIPPIVSLEELKKMKEQLAYTLFLINLGILILSGSFGYVLAGRTLKPIKIMVDEQNQFISDSSHELRTPIATLQAEMEGILLEKKITDKQARQLTKSNLEELSNLKNLANRLLLLTKNHSLLTDQKTKNISLAQILEKAKSRVNAMAKKKKINIDLKLSEAIIKGNQDRLTEVFVVLLDNAVKYSPSGSTVKVNLEKTTRKIKVSVIDQGMGISQKDLPHIFERFYRADKSRSETDGFGLGLSIAKNIIDSHHGSIEVFSRLNKGTTFEVNLPV